MPEPKKRSRISQNRRLRVYNRDGYTCRYCGRPAIPITIDHVIPLIQGGSNKESNLATCCGACNQRKADRTPEQWGRPLLSVKEARNFSTDRFSSFTPRQRRIHFFSETSIARLCYSSKESALHHSCISGWIFREQFYLRCPGCDYYHLGPLPPADQRSYDFTLETEQDILELGERAAAWLYLENNVVSKRRRQNIRYRFVLAQMIKKAGYHVALPFAS